MIYLHIFRFWLLPVLSLVATFFVPISTPALWLLWGITFVALCEQSCSAWSMGRPAFWVGLHMIPIFLL